MSKFNSIEDVNADNFTEFLAMALTKAKEAGKAQEALDVMKSVAAGTDAEMSDRIGIFSMWHLDDEFKSDVTRVVARELGH